MLALVAASAVLIPQIATSTPVAAQTPPSAETVPVTSADIVSETKVIGSVAYASTISILAGAAGVLTELPEPNSPLEPGSVLYRINTVPTILLVGTMPAWRDFTPGMPDGEDVLQLEQNLASFGLFTEAPDVVFDWHTAAAIRAWQAALGVERTGVVERSSVLFLSGQAAVADVEARVGDEVAPGTALYQATSPEKVVDLVVKSSDRAMAVEGGSVSVELPDRTRVEGVIQRVGAPFSRPNANGDGTSVVVPVRVMVTDQEALADLALASVAVVFSTGQRDDVLTVPVDALVPIDDDTYAVEVLSDDEPGGLKRLRVETGASAAGRVEISGVGIVAGLRVVVPEG